MPCKTVLVDVVVRLVVRVDEGVCVTEVLDNMGYAFASNHDNASIDNTELQNYKIVNSK